MRLRLASTTTMTAVFLLVGAAWVISVWRMTGMGMGSGLGSLSCFVVTWTAMMLRSALPSALGPDGLRRLRSRRAHGGKMNTKTLLPDRIGGLYLSPPPPLTFLPALACFSRPALRLFSPSAYLTLTGARAFL
jgi:hypothetical protein